MIPLWFINVSLYEYCIVYYSFPENKKWIQSLKQNLETSIERFEERYAPFLWNQNTVIALENQVHVLHDHINYND